MSTPKRRSSIPHYIAAGVGLAVALALIFALPYLARAQGASVTLTWNGYLTSEYTSTWFYFIGNKSINSIHANNQLTELSVRQDGSNNYLILTFKAELPANVVAVYSATANYDGTVEVLAFSDATHRTTGSGSNTKYIYEWTLGTSDLLDAMPERAPRNDMSLTLSQTAALVPVVHLSQATTAVNEGSPATFTLTSSPAPESELDVTVTISQTGSYVDTTYIGVREVSIPVAGETTFSVPTVADGVYMPNGMVTATLSDGDDYDIAGATATLSKTITNLEAAPPAMRIGRVSNRDTYTENERILFTISTSDTMTSAIAVDVRISQTGEYVASGGLGTKSVTVPASSKTATYSISLDDDSTDEPSGVVAVRIVPKPASYVIAPGHEGPLSWTVLDNDEPPPTPTPTPPPPPLVDVDVFAEETPGGAIAVFLIAPTIFAIILGAGLQSPIIGIASLAAGMAVCIVAFGLSPWLWGLPIMTGLASIGILMQLGWRGQ